MPGPDPSHWLDRLTPREWLAAAEAELAHASEALARRAARPGVTHARRAAGMAWNAVLATAPDGAGRAALVARFGRSYMEHVAALAAEPRPNEESDGPVGEASDEAPDEALRGASDDASAEIPDAVRAAARLLRDTPPAPPVLVQLGKPDLRACDAAQIIVAHARACAQVSEKG